MHKINSAFLLLLKVIYLIAIEETTTEDFTTLTISKDIPESTTLSGTTTGELVTTGSRLTETTTDGTGQTNLSGTTTGELVTTGSRLTETTTDSTGQTNLSGTTTGELVTTVSRLTETTDSTGQTQILDTTTVESNITVQSSTKASNTTSDSNSTKDERRNYTWIAYAIMCAFMVPIVGVFLFYRVRGIQKKRRLKKEQKPEQTELYHL